MWQNSWIRLRAMITGTPHSAISIRSHAAHYSIVQRPAYSDLCQNGECYMFLKIPIPHSDARGKRVQSTLLALFLLLTGLLTPHIASGQVVAPIAPGAPSPTGGTPRLLWTPQRQAAWNQMVAQNHPWWQKLKAWADGTKAQWGDIGDYSTIAYQMTGDPKYAQRAWSIIQPWASSMTLPVMNLNQTREDFISYGWMYDWLRPALTPAQRMTY